MIGSFIDRLSVLQVGSLYVKAHNVGMFLNLGCLEIYKVEMSKYTYLPT